MIPLAEEEWRTIATYRRPEFARRVVQEAYACIPDIFNSNPLWTAFDIFLKRVSEGMILDIGCGGAPFAFFFDPSSSSRYRYVGIDASFPMIEEARKNVCRGYLLNMYMQMLGFCNHCIDGIVAIGSLHHSPKARVGGILREIRRILKPGGGCFICLPYGHSEQMYSISDPHPGKGFVAFYQQEEFTEILKENDFREIECLHAYDTLYFIANSNAVNLTTT